MAGKMKAIQAHRFLFLQVSPHRFPEICFRGEGDLKVQTELDYDTVTSSALMNRALFYKKGQTWIFYIMFKCLNNQKYKRKILNNLKI